MAEEKTLDNILLVATTETGIDKGMILCQPPPQASQRSLHHRHPTDRDL